MTPLERAMKLLAARARTVLELDRALERAKIAEPDRKAALARLKDLGYLDDRELAKTRARSLIERGGGVRLVERKLAAQGIEEADAQSAVAEAKGQADDDE